MKLAFLIRDSILSKTSWPHYQSHSLSSSPTTSFSISNITTSSTFQRLVFLRNNQSFRRISCLSNTNPIQNQSNPNSSSSSSPPELLRRLLKSPGVHQGPACFDALSAKLVEKAGFEFCFTSGFSVSAARLGLPDVGLISFGEMLDQGRRITQAVSIPVIGDGDNGYGNAMNVKRTVKEFINAGFAGIILEDQVSPKACGHTHGRKVVSREEAVMRIKAAIDARKESGSDIVIVARTDSRQAISLEESLWRSRAFADAGADVLFIDALTSKDEMKALCEIFPLLPKMANMLEGGGKTPILNPIELEEIGFKIVCYPLSLVGVSIRAMQDALTAIKGGRLPPPASLPSFDEMKETLGFNAYYEEEKRYDTSTSQRYFQRGSQLISALLKSTNSNPLLNKAIQSKDIQYLSITPNEYLSSLSSIGSSPSTSNTFSIQQRSPDDTDKSDQIQLDPIIEVVTPDEVYNPASKGPLPRTMSRTLRVKITGRDGSEKLEIRIPELLDDAGEEVGGKKLVDFNDTLGDRIQVFLE